MSLRFGNGAKQWPVGWLNYSLSLKKYIVNPTGRNKKYFILIFCSRFSEYFIKRTGL